MISTRDISRSLTVGVVLLSAANASAQSPAVAPQAEPPVLSPSSPSPSATPSTVGPSTIVTDTIAPICAGSRARCEPVDEYAQRDVDVTQQVVDLTPMLRQLRRCLDGHGLGQVPASIAIRYGAPTVARFLTPGLEQDECVARALAAVASMRAETTLAARCEYECLGDRLGETAPTTPPTTVPAPALASRPSAPASATTADGESWYGWQTLIVDAAALTTLGAGLASWTVEPTAIGYGAFLLGTPIMHAVHGNVGRTFGSLLMRIFIPQITGAVGLGTAFAADKGETTEKALATAAGIGFAIGAGACILIDSAVLSWAQPERKRTAATAPIPTVGVRLGPTTTVYGTF